MERDIYKFEDIPKKENFLKSQAASSVEHI